MRNLESCGTEIISRLSSIQHPAAKELSRKQAVEILLVSTRPECVANAQRSNQ